MACGVCSKNGHNIVSCPYVGKRTVAGRGIPKKKRCECCGQYGYPTKRHHTRGRANPDYFLDLCGDCHLHCAHNGHNQNLGIKPQVCRVIAGKPSYWRGN